mgnify:CR=1 FL=1
MHHPRSVPYLVRTQAILQAPEVPGSKLDCLTFIFFIYIRAGSITLRMSPYVFEVASSRLALGRCSFFVMGISYVSMAERREEREATGEDDDEGEDTPVVIPSSAVTTYPKGTPVPTHRL